MKSKIFNTQEVQAILDGRKTQFREVIEDISIVKMIKCETSAPDDFSKYKTEDTVFVKETFCELYENDKKIIAFKNDDRFDYIDYSVKWKPSVHLKQEDARILFEITNVRVEKLQDISDEDCIKSGIYKTLDKSGCFSSYVFTVIKPIVIDDFIYTDYYCSKFEAYEELWSSKAKEDYKWEDNPYVFVYEFERVDR